MKLALRWAVYLPLFIIPFIPLYVANELFFPFITGKGFAFRILVEFAAAAWVLLALADKRYRPRFSWTFVLYSAFIVWMLIADLAGVNPHKALWSNFERMEGWVTLIHVYLFFVVSGSVLTVDKLWRKWWLTFLAAAALVSAYCLIQLAGGAQIHQGGVRVDGTFGNAAYLAAYLLFAIAAAIWQALESRGFLRYALFVLAAIEIVITYFTATRGAVIGLVAAGVVGSVLWMFESGKGARKIAGGILIGIVLIAGGFWLIRDSAFVKSEPTLARVTSIGAKDLTVRMTLWGMALHGVAERPLLGWGQEGFNYVFNKYYEPSLYAQEPWFDRAHNAFIDWLVAGGIPGFLLFLAAFATAVYSLYRGGASREERVLLVAALVAYGVQALVVFDNLFTYVPLAAILATAHAASSRPWKKVEAVREVDEQTMQLTAPVAVVLALVVVWVVNVPNIAAAGELVRAISVTSSDIGPNVQLFQQALAENTFAKQEIREQLGMFANNVIAAQQNLTPQVQQVIGQLSSFSQSELKKEVDAHPTDSRLLLEYSLGFRVVGNNAEALKQIQAAHDNSPRKQSILIEMGLNYWQLGDKANAEKAFTEAYELSPNFANELAPYAAAGMIANGKLAEGKALLNDKLGTTTANNEALMLAYYQVKDFPDLILVMEQTARDENNSPQSLFRLAAAFAEAGRISDARATLSKVVSLHPEAAAQASAFLQQIPAGAR